MYLLKEQKEYFQMTYRLMKGFKKVFIIYIYKKMVKFIRRTGIKTRETDSVVKCCTIIQILFEEYAKPICMQKEKRKLKRKLRSKK